METPLCQIAISVSDLAHSLAWFERLHLAPSGAMPPISGDLPARILELPEVEVDVCWLRGRDPMSQLELMQFRLPAPRPLPTDFGPPYQGYGIVSLVVPDFEILLAAVRAEGRPHTLTGSPRNRSLWIATPDSIPIEILERDPLPPVRPSSGDDGLSSIRAVTLTVADLDKAQRFWTSAVGLEAFDTGFNPFPSAWNGGVNDWEQKPLKGGSLIVRLLKPRGGAIRPRQRDYRLSDVGVLNVAAIVDSPQAFAALRARTSKLGYRFTTETTMEMGDAGTIYGHDDQRVSIEMGFVLPGHEVKYGWRR